MATTDPSPMPPAQPALLAPRNPFAVPSLVLGVVAQVVGAAFSLGRTATLLARVAGSGSSIQIIGVIGAIETVVVGLLGLAGLVLGLVALLPRTRPRRAVAAAGTAIGAVIVFGVLITILNQVLLAAASS